MAISDLPKTCRALRQNVYAQAPVVEEIPTPQPFPGAAVLKIELAAIISYMKVFDLPPTIYIRRLRYSSSSPQLTDRPSKYMTAQGSTPIQRPSLLVRELLVASLGWGKTQPRCRWDSLCSSTVSFEAEINQLMFFYPASMMATSMVPKSSCEMHGEMGHTQNILLFRWRAAS